MLDLEDLPEYQTTDDEGEAEVEAVNQ